MHLLLIGGGGQLGRCLQDRAPASWRITAPSSGRLDLADIPAVQGFFSQNSATPFDGVINASAYNAVDAAETDQAGAFAVNAQGPTELARLARACGARFVHVSTDYVFSGASGRPYTEDDAPDPVSVYGRSKRAGELGVLEHNPDALVIRTSWLYSEYGRNFVKTMLALAAQGRALTVVNDQVGTPTYAGDLADVIIGLIQRPDIKGGLYHYAGADIMSWFDLACAALEGLPHNIAPVDSAGYPTVAPRPACSALACPRVSALGFLPQPQAARLAHVRQQVMSAGGQVVHPVQKDVGNQGG